MVNIKVTTNIEELERHINAVFKGMLKSAELKEAGKIAGQTIGRMVGEHLESGGDSGYNYTQSGGLKELVLEEANTPDIQQRQNDLTIGVFQLDNMNKANIAMRNAQFQNHEIWDAKEGKFINKRIFLKQENQMPKWILAEFGSKSGASGTVPPDFKINYTKRDKPYMFGPSIGPVMGEGGGSKRGFFMVTGPTLMNLLGKRAENRRNFREHPGIKAGHIFSGGLEKSKEQVFEILGDGVQEYLDSH